MRNQWLFDAPFTPEVIPDAYPEYYSYPELETEWELQENYYYRSLLTAEESNRRTACPAVKQLHETVEGFPRYQQSVKSLPKREQEKIDNLARLIVESFNPGCRSIHTIRLVGHADRDWQRGAEFEKKISGDRALEIQKALIDSINRQSRTLRRVRGGLPLSSQIVWMRVTAGASQLAVKNPKIEQERARNRRVEIFLITSKLLTPIHKQGGWCFQNT